MPMLFGFIGLWNTVLFWPGFLLLRWGAWEESPLQGMTTPIFLSLLANGLLGTVLSDLLWAKSVLLASPLISTVGLSLTIPVALVLNTVLGDGPSFSLPWVLRTRAR